MKDKSWSPWSMLLTFFTALGFLIGMLVGDCGGERRTLQDVKAMYCMRLCNPETQHGTQVRSTNEYCICDTKLVLLPPVR